MIRELYLQNKRAKSLCEELEEELIEQQGLGISWETIKHLSKWCDTGGSYANVESLAKEISALLFGKVLKRLDQLS